MVEVGVLVNYIIQDYSKDDNNLLINLLKKSLKVIDDDINENNGLAGFKIKTHLLIANSTSERNRILPLYLKKNPSIKFVDGNSSLRELLDIKKIIFLQTNTTNSCDDNVFMISRVSNESKINQIKFFISTFKKLKKVYFFHDNKRLKKYENSLSESLNKKFHSFDFSNFKDEDNIVKQVDLFLKSFSKNDILILDVGNRVTRHIFKFLNKYPDKIGLVLLVFISLEGKYTKFNFPLVEIKSNQVISASLQLRQILKKTNVPISERQLELFLISSFRLDYPLLFKEASNKIISTPTSIEQLLNGIISGLKSIDGDKDIFVGPRNIYAFKNNKNIFKDNFSFVFPESMFDGKNFHKVFYRTQFVPRNNEILKLDINTINFDIIRITNVNIAEGTWSCEFKVNVTTRHKNPIDFIIFNNLSMINREYETKLINSKSSRSGDSMSYEYYIVANFDFEAKSDNYPFDWQHLYISYSISNEKKYGHIQPVPEQLLDKKFKLEGWKLKSSISGIKRTKLITFEDYGLIQKASVKEEARVGWTLVRANYITITKIVIPLTFLMFLNYYVLFFTYETALRQIGILTTTFLSGIALYFSAERPQPLRLTTIDLIFIWYYIQSGIIIVTSAISYKLGENKFYESMYLLKFIAPIGLIALIVFLFFRIKAIRLRPNIS